MALNFPDSPSANTTYSYAGKTWEYTGTAWRLLFSETTSAAFTGNVTAANLLPPSDDTGAVGNASNTWNSGHFTNLTIDTLGSISGTLNVRTALDLGDDDPLRLGDNDDIEIYHDGTNSYIDLNSGNLIFRDVISNRATFVRHTGDFNTIGNVSAAFFIGDGSALINVRVSNSNITGNIISSQLQPTGVTATTYGNATIVPVITVDQQGRITSASNVALSATSGGGTITFSSTEPASPSVGDRWVNDDGIEFVYFDDGTSTQWVDFNSNFSLPTQTGNSGKYLITNGNTPSWTTLTIAGATGSSFSNSQILSGILNADASALRVGSGSLVFNTGPTINTATLNNPSVVNANISGNLTIVNGNITGTVFATAPAITSNTTQIATTAFVQDIARSINSNVNSTNVYFTSGYVSGVTSGAYGNATLIPALTVDSTGRITAASNVSIVGGATLADANLLSSSTFYPTLSSSNTGSYTTATVSLTNLYFVPNTGTFSATTFNSLSDLNLKTNVRVIENGFNLLEPLIPVSFNWKDTGIHSFGLIAQEIEKIYPELVCTNDLGVKSVAYSPIIAMLISAIKELKQEIDELKGK